MVGKLTQTAEGLTLVLSPEMLATLLIDAQTRFEVTAAGKSFVATPVADTERRARFQKAFARANE